MSEKLRELRRRLQEIDDLRAVYNLLNWDQQTHMPIGGAEARGRESALVARLEHERFTDPEMGRLLDALEPLERERGYDDDDASLVRVTRRLYEHATRFPTAFWSRLFEHSSRTYEAWARARAEDDFSLVREHLEVTLELSIELAEFNRPWDHVMDGLTWDREYGTTAGQVRRLFGELVDGIVPLVKEIAESPAPDDSFLRATWPRQGQLAFAADVARDLGYDFERGRLDTTRHPFASRLSRGDVRITTRVNERDLRECLFSTIHEAGHAMYEQGVAENLAGTPLSRRGASHGMHESQSRLWENLVGRSMGFWEHRFPALRDTFPEQLTGVDAQAFYRAINRVEPGTVRLFADELTYNLHIIIRTELELDLLEGKLAIRDLEEAWNAKYEAYLGIQPASANEGVLQDVHWYGGTIVLPAIIGGAFQGYALGNLIGAQLYATAASDRPALEEDIVAGRFSWLHGWLTDRVYRHGRKYLTPELIERATGSELSTAPYLAYVRGKFGEIYGLRV